MTASEVIAICTSVTGTLTTLGTCVLALYLRAKTFEVKKTITQQEHLNEQSDKRLKEVKADLKEAKTESKRLQHEHTEMAKRCASLEVKTEYLRDQHERCEKDSKSLRERVENLASIIEEMKAERGEP